MYKCEIVTDTDRHYIELHDFDSLGSAVKFVENKLTSVDKVAEFWGKNSLLVLNLYTGVVRSYKVWYEDHTPKEDLISRWNKEQAAAQEPEGIPTNWAGFAHYLGQKITVEGLRLEYGGLAYLMPLKIDGKHPYDALRTDNLNAFMLGLKTKYEIDVIVSIPSITFSEAEAVAYLVDYAVAHNPDPVRNVGETTGRAAGVLWEK